MWLSSLKLAGSTNIKTENLTNEMNDYEVKTESGNKVISGKFMKLLGKDMNYVEIKKDSWTIIAKNITNFGSSESSSPLQVKFGENKEEINSNNLISTISKENVKYYKIDNVDGGSNNIPEGLEKDFNIRLNNSELQIRASSKLNKSDKIWLSSLKLSGDIDIKTENLTENMKTYEVKSEKGLNVISGKFMNLLGRNMEYVEIKKDSWTTIAKNILLLKETNDTLPLKIKIRKFII